MLSRILPQFMHCSDTLLHNKCNKNQICKLFRNFTHIYACKLRYISAFSESDVALLTELITNFG